MGEERVEGRVLVVDGDPELRRLTAPVLALARRCGWLQGCLFGRRVVAEAVLAR